MRRLDVKGYHFEPLERRAEVDAWLRSIGGDPHRTREIILEAEGTVLLDEVELDADGRRTGSTRLSRYEAPTPPPFVAW